MTAVDDHCTRCRHQYHHHPEGGPCRVQLSKDWDGQVFKTTEVCLCQGYQGLIPRGGGGGGCPHEFIKGSARCVHCSQVRAPRL